MAGDTYVVERSTQINAPLAEVRERLVDFRRWQAWSPWEDIDPTMTRNYSGAEAGEGAEYSWKGNRKAGEGSMRITNVDEHSVSVDLRFVKPFKSESKVDFLLRDEAAGTGVTWRMTGPTTFMTKVMGIFKSMDSMIGPDFEKGLQRLKADAEGTSS